MLAGLPLALTTDLEKNPDFSVADSVQWERHVTHRLQQEQDDANKQKKELKEAQALLLKLQLAEAKNKVSEKKKEIKETAKKMMVAWPEPDPVPDWPDLDQNLYPDDRMPVNTPRQRQPAGNWVAVAPQRRCVGYVRGGSKGLVVRGIAVRHHGMLVGDAELTDTGLDNALDRPKVIKGKSTKLRHVELKEDEVPTEEHIKLQIQVQRQSPSTQQLTGAGRGSSTDGALRARTVWQNPCCQ